MPEQPRAKLEHLRALDADPPAQTAYALRLLKDRTVDVVLAAIAVLGEREDPAVRAPFLSLYAKLASHPARRDPGGRLRIALLDALCPIADSPDAALFERAATTYEFLYGEVAGDLRAAGLRALASVDPVLATYHAVRLLDDVQPSSTEREPAYTAVRVLVAQGQHLPIYAYVLRESAQHPDVLGEGLRALTNLPPSLLPPLIERFRQSPSEIVLLGLFDLLLAHRERAAHLDTIYDFLTTTPYLNLYRYLSIMLTNLHDPAVDRVLDDMAARVRDPQKRAIWNEARALRRP